MYSTIKKLITVITIIVSIFFNPLTPTAKANTSEAACLATVMHHEARGEGQRGQTAVAYVVLNRTRDRNYPKSICSVVYQRGQFSDIHRASLPANTRNYFLTLANTLISSYSITRDPTRGAIAFHNTSVRPAWRGLVRTITLGNHIFYRRRG